MKTINAITPGVTLLVLALLGSPHTFAGKPGGGTGGGSSAGVVTIDQASAGNGGVTNGDTAGFPVTISEPGSYRLESNLVVPDTATTAIKVTANDVTIDMNGFVIQGPNVCSLGGSCNAFGGGDGINSSGEHTTVFGGTVRGMGGSGLYLGPNSHVERMHAQHNGGTGIVVFDKSLLTDSTAELNYYYGIWAGNGSLVLRNVIGSNYIGAHFSQFPGRVAFGENFFFGNVYLPFEGLPVTVMPNVCYPSGC